MSFTPEMLNAAKNAKTAEELIALAKENNIEATEEEIRTYYEQTHTTGELADDELDNVAGGCGGGGDSGSGESYYNYPDGCIVRNIVVYCNQGCGNNRYRLKWSKSGRLATLYCTKCNATHTLEDKDPAMYCYVRVD